MPSSTIHPEPGLELIPGYRLRAILGKGGYGEVWDAVGPGNVVVALKLVPLAEQLAGPDLRSLQMLPVLRHPSLLEVHGIHIKGGHLILVMERAHGTLADLLREAMTSHGVALPRPDVLGWMVDVARGLDYLNEAGTTPDGIAKPAIIHRDIKPQNILLVGTGVKIGDFGLARVLEQAATAHSGAMTPAFAPPEFFRGQTTRSSDQYSLAVMYVQLVGGKLPFVGSPAEVMLGHIEKAPDLSMLSENDRAVVGRALAKDPGRRWPTCEAFISALLQVGSGKSFGPEVGYSTEDFNIELPSAPSCQPTIREALPFGPRDSAEAATRTHKGDLGAPPPRRSRLIVALVGLVVVGILGAGGVWWATRSADADGPVAFVSARVEPVSLTERVVLEAGQSAKVVLAVQRLEQGRVRLAFADLPPGVRADEVLLAEGESEATFSLHAEATAADGRRWATLGTPGAPIGRVEVVVHRDLAASLPRLREELTRPATRDRAAGDLSELGPRAAPACPDLVACLNDYGAGVPCPPADALVVIGVGAVPSLAAALGQKNPRSGHAIDTLVRIGPSATSAILDVVKAGPGEQKRDAATALGRMSVVPPAALDFLVGCLTDPFAAPVAAMSLVRMGGPGFAPVVEAFERDATRREILGTALGSARGPSGKAVCDAMVRLLDSKDADLWRAACRVLGHLGGAGRDAADRLGRALEGEDARTKIEAAVALWAVSGQRGTAALIDLLDHADATIQRGAYDALAGMDPGPGTHTALQDGLKSTEAATRRNSVRALGAIGPNSRGAAATLAELLVTHSDDDDETNLLFEALENIGPGARAAEPKLIGILEKGNRYHQAKAAKTLGHISPLSRPVEVALNKATGDPSQNVAAAAVAALRENQPVRPEKRPPMPGGPELLDRAQGRDLAPRIEALDAMGPTGTFTLLAVTRSLRHSEPSVRLAACRALWRIDRRAVALEKLMDLALVPGDEGIRSAALDALGEIGPDAMSVAPRLRPLLEVDDAMRGKAALALHRIEANKPALTILSDLLRSRRVADRLEGVTACLALGKALPNRLRNFLAPLLHDRDRLTRTRAIEAMMALDPADARKQLGL